MYHNEEHRYLPITSSLSCDPDALLIGSVTLHLGPKVSVQQETVATRGSHYWIEGGGEVGKGK